MRRTEGPMWKKALSLLLAAALIWQPNAYLFAQENAEQVQTAGIGPHLPALPATLPALFLRVDPLTQLSRDRNPYAELALTHRVLLSDRAKAVAWLDSVFTALEKNDPPVGKDDFDKRILEAGHYEGLLKAVLELVEEEIASSRAEPGAKEPVTETLAHVVAVKNMLEAGRGAFAADVDLKELESFKARYEADPSSLSQGDWEKIAELWVKVAENVGKIKTALAAAAGPEPKGGRTPLATQERYAEIIARIRAGLRRIEVERRPPIQRFLANPAAASGEIADEMIKTLERTIDADASLSTLQRDTLKSKLDELRGEFQRHLTGDGSTAGDLARIFDNDEALRGLPLSFKSAAMSAMQRTALSQAEAMNAPRNQLPARYREAFQRGFDNIPALPADAGTANESGRIREIIADALERITEGLPQGNNSLELVLDAFARSSQVRLTMDLVLGTALYQRLMAASGAFGEKKGALDEEIRSRKAAFDARYDVFEAKLKSFEDLAAVPGGITNHEEFVGASDLTRQLNNLEILEHVKTDVSAQTLIIGLRTRLDLLRARIAAAEAAKILSLLESGRTKGFAALRAEGAFDGLPDFANEDTIAIYRRHQRKLRGSENSRFRETIEGLEAFRRRHEEAHEPLVEQHEALIKDWETVLRGGIDDSRTYDLTQSEAQEILALLKKTSEEEP
ncbi:MAG: hypothetical protein V3S11_04360, partial [Elusimicrobiota bacterium]